VATYITFLVLLLLCKSPFFLPFDYAKPSQSFFPTSLMKINLGKHNFGKVMDFAIFEGI
jgi:hypothetical protein